VYILILPAFGIISEVLPVFSRKPIFGYTFVAWSGVAIGFLSFTVWAHHMFAVGLPPIAQAFFATSTTLIAIPTAVKIFNWIATITFGKIKFDVPMLFALGFIAMFLIGGLDGVALAVVPFDYQVTDTYFVVSHLHYVLFGGTVFGIFAGFYYWFPKMSGKLLNKRLGQIQFWLMLIGVNMTFFSMHILGLLGMPRRIYTYPDNLGWNELNLLQTVGAFMLGTAIMVFFWNLIVTLRNGEDAGTDPWDAFTLEWDTASPPAHYNFETIPIVRSRRPFYDKKNPEIADWKTATH
jgi:cytochrome c oxidase subunit 1